IKRGETAAARLTMPEGFTVEQTLLRLEANQISDLRTLRSAIADLNYTDYPFLPAPSSPVPSRLEGYLFPDTYDFYRGMPAEQVITRMLANFNRRTEDLQAEAAKQNKPLADVVILGSLIEKEARTDADRKLI